MQRRGKSPNPYYAGPPVRSFRRRNVLQSGRTEPARFRRSPEMAVRRRARALAARLAKPVSAGATRRDGRRDGALRLTMVGHATLLVQMHGLNILTDPVWSERVSPLSFAGPKRVNAPGIAFADLPPIDLVLVSHNHYDHLDLATLARLKAAHDPLVITPLGNDAIIRAGVPDMRIETRDWGESVEVGNGVDRPCRAGASLVGARRARPLDGAVVRLCRRGAGGQGLFRRRYRVSRRPRLPCDWPRGTAAFAWPSCRSAPTSRAGSWRRSTRIRKRRWKACNSAMRPSRPAAIGARSISPTSRSTSRARDLLAALDASGIARERFRPMLPGEVWDVPAA